MFFRIKKTSSEFIGYFIISLLALTVDLSIFSLSIRLLGYSWFFSASLGFVVGIFVAYILSIIFVFSERKKKDHPLTEFVIFMSIGIGGLIVTQIVLFFGIEWLHLQAELIKILAAGFTFLYNYLLRKYFLFTNP